MLTAKQTEIHGSQRMNPNDFSDWLTVPLMSTIRSTFVVSS